MVRLLVVALGGLALAACGKSECTGGSCAPPEDTSGRPERYCPGQAGCQFGANDVFMAGAARRDLSPRHFEVALDAYLKRHDNCPGGTKACAEVSDLAFKDCGTDGLCKNDRFCGTDKLCPGDNGYGAPDADGSERIWTAPDKDGTEGDHVPDFFRDCGVDGLCPGDPGYTAPDADGSEKNGRFDGFWMAGFSVNRPMQGVHDPIWSRVLVLQNGDVTVGFVAFDSVGIFYENEVVSLRKKVAALGVPIDYLLVSATHTHEAPDTMGQWGMLSVAYGNYVQRGVNDAWLADAVEQTAQAVKEAYDGMKPAKAKLAVARTGFDGWVKDTRDPVIYDDRIRAFQAVDAASGETIGTLVNYASHPEALGGDNVLATSDYPHALREGVEKGLAATATQPAVPGVGGVAVFVNGPLGGLIGPLSPVKVPGRDGKVYEEGSFEKADALGQNLAAKVLEALAGAREVEGAALPITVRAQTLKLSVENIQMQLAMDALELFTRPTYDKKEGETFRNVRTEIGVVRVGPATFVSMPGEMFPEMTVGFGEEWSLGKTRIQPENPNPPDLTKAPAGPFLLEMFDNELVFPLGLTNDELGYLVPAYDYKLHPVDPYFSKPPGDHYEETNGIGPGTCEKVFEVYDALRKWEPATKASWRR